MESQETLWNTITALQSLVLEVSELIMNRPQHGKYKALKSRVMPKFRDGEEKLKNIA